MKVFVLDAFAEETPLTAAVKETLLDCRHEYCYLKVHELNILPCYGCSGCSFKTSGECVFKDDMPLVMRQLVRSDLSIYLLPVRYGGYPSALKKIVDKSTLTVAPLLEVKQGRMFHPSRYGRKSAIAIGLNEKGGVEREDNFRKIFDGNAFNAQMKYHRAIILHSLFETGQIVRELRSAFKEVENIG